MQSAEGALAFIVRVLFSDHMDREPKGPKRGWRLFAIAQKLVISNIEGCWRFSFLFVCLSFVCLSARDNGPRLHSGLLVYRSLGLLISSVANRFDKNDKR